MFRQIKGFLDVDVCFGVCSDLKILGEQRQDVQDAQTHLCGDVALQQSLVVDFCL